ncbi:hypothetical protein QJ854_gp113 [Moumouvirus goulette]|uniref:Uncharacterized protein n=1 Tax=Moumouvirus goulette TaxID=1247379 RepID=M1PCG4_9VIRU|nr:hypothetical protein QJ854_gp113 [Moumouvirus goulette]AGF85669.1 hypothetical protein glt_00866 [Moumouvirus goulette]
MIIIIICLRQKIIFMWQGAKILDNDNKIEKIYSL